MADALRIAALSTRGFRNLGDAHFEPGPRFNVISGDNAQGKSNLLEAIDYLASLRSFRGAVPSDMIASGAAEAELSGVLHGDAAARRFRVRLRREGGRELQLDGKRPRTRASYLVAIQTALFHPGDLELVSGGKERRRAFVDRILEHFDATYASSLAVYERALRSRNSLLRAERHDRGALTAYHELLASSGAVVGQSRARLLDELGPLALDAFHAISGEPGTLAIRYEPRVTPDLSAILAALEASIEKDIARGFTAEGPHADEIALSIDGVPAKRYASQGQHRAIVLALKVAELHQLTRRVGRVPMLLLDDVSSELDSTRNRRLFDLLAELGGQVFLTTTQPDLILLDQDRSDFSVRHGVIRAR
jgi:DNA replication and repair protein RecF